MTPEDLQEDLPEPARCLLSAHVTTVPELIALLALIDCPARWWDIRTMSAGTGLPWHEARRALEALASANLLDIRVSDDVRYQLRPGTAALEEMVQALVHAYRLVPGAVLRFVTGRGGMTAVEAALRFRP